MNKNQTNYDVIYFERPDESLSFRQLLKPQHLPPESPGVYGWYFDYLELPPYVPLIDCSFYKTGWWLKDYWYLLYIGRASNLRERIVNEHLFGELVRGKAMSSLRQSIGCLLSRKLKICLWKFPDFPRREYTFGEKGEEKLARWMYEHTRVAWVETEDYVEMEKEAIEYYTLPLNTEGSIHFFIEPLQELKKDIRDCAEFLGSNRRPKRCVRKAYRKFVKQCKELGIKK